MKKVMFTPGQPLLKKTEGHFIDIGDMIILKKKDYCPSDIVLFDCKDDWCFVDTIEIDGVSKYMIKRPLSLFNGNQSILVWMIVNRYI